MSSRTLSAEHIPNYEWFLSTQPFISPYFTPEEMSSLSFSPDNSRLIAYFIREGQLVSVEKDNKGWNSNLITEERDVTGFTFNDLFPDIPGDELIINTRRNYYPSIWNYDQTKDSWLPIIQGKHAWSTPHCHIVGNFRKKGRPEMVVQTTDGIFHLLEFKDSQMNLVWKSPQQFRPVDIWRAADIDNDGRDELIVAFGDRGVAIYKEKNGALVQHWVNYPWGRVLDLVVHGKKVIFSTSQKKLGVIEVKSQHNIVMDLYSISSTQSYRWLYPLNADSIMGVTLGGRAFLIYPQGKIYEKPLLESNGPVQKLSRIDLNNFVVYKANGEYESWFLRNRTKLIINGLEYGLALKDKITCWDNKIYFRPDLLQSICDYSYQIQEGHLSLTLKSGEIINLSLYESQDILQVSEGEWSITANKLSSILNFKLRVISTENELLIEINTK